MYFRIPGTGSLHTYPYDPRKEHYGLKLINGRINKTEVLIIFFDIHTANAVQFKENCEGRTWPGSLATYTSNNVPHARNNYVLTMQKTSQITTKVNQNTDEGYL